MRTLFLPALPSTASTAAPARATRPGARSARSGTRPGWPSPPRWCRAAAGRRAARRPHAGRRRCRSPATTTLRAAHQHAVVRVRRRGGRGAQGREPGLKVGLVGAEVAVEPRRSLAAAPAVDFVAAQRVRLHHPGGRRGPPLERVDGLSLPRRRRRDRPQRRTAPIARGHGPAALRDAGLQARPDHRELLHRLPPASLRLALHRPRLPSKCTFCLWPQTVGGHRYRTRSVGHVVEEIALGASGSFPQVKEFFFDDDTFTDDLPRAEAIARELGQARRHLVAATPRPTCRTTTLKVHAGQRPPPAAGGLRVGQPADPEQHQEGHAASTWRGAFTRDCQGARHHHPRHLHPRAAGRDAARRSRRPSASPREIDPHTIQVSLAAPYPGHRALPARRARRLARDDEPSWWTTAACRWRRSAIRTSPRTEIFRLGRRVLPPLLLPPAQDALARRRDGAQTADHGRRLREGVEFFPFLRERRELRALKRLIITADDFGLSEPVNAAIEEAHRARHPERDKPHGRRGRGRGRGRAGAPAAATCASGCMSF